ncbi:MAG: SGNH/GDSL hydrolase family protein [Candidatus Wallbacteria bacterium]|nr:SGNH/GDSL hydrolase family protein [Candidatus Wallbacteria bacterium]
MEASIPPVTGGHFNYLLFFDSRGYTTCSDNTLTIADMTVSCLKASGMSFLAVFRPLNLTIFPTLINFLVNQSLSFDVLITNLGFVDHTPKKIDLVEDMIRQSTAILSDWGNIIELEEYRLSSGELTTLKSIEYSADMEKLIGRTLAERFSKAFLVNTPVIDKNWEFERPRPECFFQRILSANELVRRIARLSTSKLIDISGAGKFGRFAYDAVHYTGEGHKTIGDLIIAELHKNRSL